MDEAQKSVRDAEAIAEEFKTFVYSVSHDLSAPIRGMVEFSKLLKAEHQDVLNDEGQLYLSLIVESGEKLQVMLAGLLQYSRLNTIPLRPTKINLIDTIAACKKALKDQIEASGAEITIDAKGSLKADADNMEQLFMALIDNAIKFQAGRAKPQIIIMSEDRGSETLFTVSDNGIGIASEFHSEVFKPFKRLHGDVDYKGAGIGLALAKKLVERHGGKIWIEPRAAEGLQLQFTLPHEPRI